MTKYVLLDGVNQINPIPPSPIIRPVPVSQQNNLSVQFGNIQDPNLAISPPENQAFQVSVTGAGAVSASVQIYGSNDRVNWIKIGNPITATGTNSGTAGGQGTVGYSFFGALLTALSGTSARAYANMNA